MMSVQPVLLDASVMDLHLNSASEPIDTRSRGAVFTKPEVVDFMLDLVGYSTQAPLHEIRLLEPSCGSGSFLFRAVQRLLNAWKRSDRPDSILDKAVRAVELDESTYEATHGTLVALLVEEGLPELSAARIVKKWLINADYLTTHFDSNFDVIIGNPPYVRQELIEPRKLAHYRRCYPTMIGRADIYVAFFEKSLNLLNPGGKLSLICADAWTRNEYGRELRQMITSNYALRVYVDMYGLDSFETNVGAYPSITVIERGIAGPIQTARATSVKATDLSVLSSALTQSTSDTQTLAPLPSSGAPWLLTGCSAQEVVRQLERTCLPLEVVGCKVGIGVATGADRVFVAPFDDLPIEDDRKLPLAVNKDVTSVGLAWHGMGVVNPWAEVGGLVNLEDYPQLSQYLRPHRDRLSHRHTAKGDPETRWYKTIDRISAHLTWQPKLLVPDIRGDGDAIAYDSGTVYPHHNLYHITSSSWNLRALQALLRSGLARLFVEAYAVKIGGGYMRFQAQYLRRIHIPDWKSLSTEQQNELVAAGEAGTKLPPETLESLCGLDHGSLDFMKEW